MIFIYLLILALNIKSLTSFTGIVKLVDLSHIEVPYEQGWKWQKSLVDHHIKLQENPGNVIGHVNQIAQIHIINQK